MHDAHASAEARRDDADPSDRHRRARRRARPHASPSAPYTRRSAPHVRIGAGTTIGPHCVIEGRTTHRPRQPHLPVRARSARRRRTRSTRGEPTRARDRRPQHHPRVLHHQPRHARRTAASRASATTTGSWPTCTSRTTARSATTRSSPTTRTLAGHVRRRRLGRSSAGFTGVHQFVQDRRARDDRHRTALSRRTCRRS